MPGLPGRQPFVVASKPARVDWFTEEPTPEGAGQSTTAHRRRLRLLMLYWLLEQCVLIGLPPGPTEWCMRLGVSCGGGIHRSRLGLFVVGRTLSTLDVRCWCWPGWTCRESGLGLVVDVAVDDLTASRGEPPFDMLSDEWQRVCGASEPRAPTL